jgi:hypothetical protein
MPGNAGHFFAPNKPLVVDRIGKIERRPLLLTEETRRYAP